MRSWLLALVVLIPSLAQAAFEQVYTTADPLLEIGVPTEIPIFFDTNSVDLSGFGAPGVFGWGMTAQGTGDLMLLSFSGPYIDVLSTCLTVDGSQQSCSLIDDGSMSGFGIEGIEIPIGTFTVLAQSPDDVFYFSTADFTDGDFSTAGNAPWIVAAVSPTPVLPQPPDPTDPNTGMTDDPNTGMTDPNVGMTDPNTDLTEPNVGTTDPNTGTTEPNLPPMDFPDVSIPGPTVVSSTPVPEPGAAVLFLMGLGVVALRLRRR